MLPHLSTTSGGVPGVAGVPDAVAPGPDPPPAADDLPWAEIVGGVTEEQLLLSGVSCRLLRLLYLKVNKQSELYLEYLCRAFGF